MTSSGANEQTLLAQRYRLEHRVGFGSMGAVWRARDERLLRTVAVKQLLTQPGAPGFDPQGPEFGDARERMLREGRLAARLQHVNTIGVYDVVVHDDVPWLVMEYLESRTLGQLTAEEGLLDPRRAAEIGRQVADGLVAAHAAGIVHRDIKPSNVLIGTDGSVKITDFGVSRAADDVQLTRTGLIAGTPAYLAPEVARGEIPTPASDVFALGSTIYACVEGTPPFGLDDNAYAMLYTVGSGEVRLPSRAGLLGPTLMWMLDKDPARRPTAAQARDELARVAGGGQPAGSPGAGYSPTLVSPVVPPSVGQPVRTAVPPSPAPVAASFGATGTRVDLRNHGPDGDPSGFAGPSGGGPVAPVGPGVSDGSSGSDAARGGPGWDQGFARPGSGRARSGWWAAGAVAVLLLAIVVGVALATPSSRSAGTGSNPPAATRATDPPAAPGSTARALPPSTPGRAGQGQPSAEELEEFVRDYYDLLPDDVDKAWEKLGPVARRESGSLDSYRRFYDGVSGVRFAEGPTAVDGRTVRATLLFDGPDRPAGGAGESYTFIVEPGPDGELMMTSFSR